MIMGEVLTNDKYREQLSQRGEHVVQLEELGISMEGNRCETNEIEGKCENVAEFRVNPDGYPDESQDACYKHIAQVMVAQSIRRPIIVIKLPYIIHNENPR